MKKRRENNKNKKKQQQEKEVLRGELETLTEDGGMRETVARARHGMAIRVSLFCNSDEIAFRHGRLVFFRVCVFFFGDGHLPVRKSAYDK